MKSSAPFVEKERSLRASAGAEGARSWASLKTAKRSARSNRQISFLRGVLDCAGVFGRVEKFRRDSKEILRVFTGQRWQGPAEASLLKTSSVPKLDSFDARARPLRSNLSSWLGHRASCASAQCQQQRRRFHMCRNVLEEVRALQKSRPRADGGSRASFPCQALVSVPVSALERYIHVPDSRDGAVRAPAPR